MMTPHLKATFYRLSLDSVGFYPQAVTDADGIRHERTPWEEGWNAARSQVSQTYGKAVRWFQALPRDHQAAVTTLMESPALEVDIAEDEIILSWRCNDTFLWGCADAEELPAEAWMLLATLWRSYGDAGILAWIALQRHEVPMAPLITPAYTAAVAWLTPRRGEVGG